MSDLCRTKLRCGEPVAHPNIFSRIILNNHFLFSNTILPQSRRKHVLIFVEVNEPSGFLGFIEIKNIVFVDWARRCLALRSLLNGSCLIGTAVDAV